jgi:hypothetical protein
MGPLRSLGKGISVNRERLQKLFGDIDLGSSAPPRMEHVADCAAEALRTIGIDAEVEAKIATASRSIGVSFANAGIGVGFAAWVTYEATHSLGTTVLEHGIDAVFGHAEKWAGFIIDVLTHPETWSDVGNLVIHFFENAATMPIGTIQAAADIIDSLSHAGSFIENMDAIDGFTHLADAADAATTLGLSIALSYIAGKFVDAIVEDKLQPRAERVRVVQSQLTEVLKLRHVLSTRIPAPAIAPHLDRVAQDHWAF